MIITIDGPAASGKSSAARALAQKLHFYYLNSGMLYRALGYCLLHNGHSDLEHLRSCDITTRQKCLETLHYRYDVQTGVMKMFIGDSDVTAQLKDPIIDKAASLVGENKQARTFLMNFQRSLANDYNLVAEGRDAGSVVFPDADLKFFLTARLEVRALRWFKDQHEKGNKSITFEDALTFVKERDNRDTQRAHAPLHIHADDIVLDNSNLSLQETIEKLCAIISENKK